MIQFQENIRPDEPTDGRTLFYSTFLATVGGPKETKKKPGALRIMIVRTKKAQRVFKYEISDFQNKEFVIYHPKQRFFYS